MKNLSKVLLIAIVGVICFDSCKKHVTNEAITEQIILYPLQVSGKVVTLKWSKGNADLIYGYKILKITDTSINPIQSASYSHVDKNVTEFTDTLPLLPYVEYYITAERGPSNNVTTLTSNKKSYIRKDINFMKILPKDVIFDKDSHTLILYSSIGNIIRYDIPSKQVTNQLNTQVDIGFCDIATYNGVRELYVPRSDGKLMIYNATTLEAIDQINIGKLLASVSNNNGYLFVNSIEDSIACYNRSTKVLISKTRGGGYDSRLKLVPGTNSEFFAANSANEIGYYKFANNGTYISGQSSYLSPYIISSNPFEVSPSGEYCINSFRGNIIKKDLTTTSSLYLGPTNYITSFAFNESNQLIYAGYNAQAIKVYSMNDFSPFKTIVTQGYPLKVFYDNGSILSVSCNQNYYSGTYDDNFLYTFIEQL